MWKSVLVVVVGITALSAIRRGWGWWLRRRGLARLDPDAVVRQERGVTIRALLYGAPPMLGLNPRRTNHLRGDLALTADKFVLASSRGVLADLGPGRGRRFSSARCTGPGRLVIEGDIPRPDGRAGLYRFELVVDDAPGWATALAPFVRDDGQSPQFGGEAPPWAGTS